MPIHKDFHGHIVWVNHASTGNRCTRKGSNRNNRIPEYIEQVSGDKRTVTCYIAAETGRFFAGTWWCSATDPRTAQPYTAEFMRDGESVFRGLFNRRASATVQGLAGEWICPEVEDGDEEDDDDRRYYFMFRGIEGIGIAAHLSNTM